jgi:hypothetical protein
VTLNEGSNLSATEVKKSRDVKVESTHGDVVEKLLALSVDLINEGGISSVRANISHSTRTEGLLNKSRLGTLVLVHVVDDESKNLTTKINLELRSVRICKCNKINKNTYV